MKNRILLFLILFLSGCQGQKHAPGIDLLTISTPYEFDSLDPHAKNTFSNIAILSHFYEPLVITDPNMKIKPCLATFWETPDPQTWMFHLRKGVRFQNGKEFTAEDVVYTFERLQKRKDLQISGYAFSIDRVEAVDPYLVRIRTFHPLSILLNKIRLILIIPKGATDEFFLKQANGTGPYRLEEWEKGHHVSIVRREDYWGSRAAVGRAKFLIFRTPDQAMEDLLKGRAELAQCNSPRVDKVFGNWNRWIQLHRHNIFMKYLSYDMARDQTPYANTRTNPFKNKLVRQAIHLAINRKALAAHVGNGAAPASQPIPPFIFGHNPHIPIPNPDTAKAKGLLQQAGYPDGFSVTLHARRILEPAAFYIRDELAKIGIRVNVQVTDDPGMLNMLIRRESSFFLSRMGCPTGDVSDILDNNFHSYDAVRRYGQYNFGNYSNPALDRSIEASAEIPDVQERLIALQEIMQQLMQDLVWIPLYFDQDIYVMDRKFHWQPRSDSFILAYEIES